MTSTTTEEMGWDPGKSTWNGVALAEAADKDELELPVQGEAVVMDREAGDGASSASSVSENSEPSDVEAVGVPEEPWERDEMLLEELLR